MHACMHTYIHTYTHTSSSVKTPLATDGDLRAAVEGPTQAGLNGMAGGYPFTF